VVHFEVTADTLSLSEEQADLFKEAIAANRRAESILNEMRSISQEVLLKSAPGTRKKSSRKIIPKGSELSAIQP
jgi:predicted DNA-binding helix-hairpin-helix protein